MKKYLLILITLFSFTTKAQNRVLSFNGTNDYLNLGSNAGNNIRTIELWFKPNQVINSNLSDFITLVQRETSLSSFAPFEFGLHFSSLPGSKGKIRFSINDSNSTNYSVFSNSNSWNTDQWYHVAGVVHPITGMKLYINGKQQIDSNSYTGHTNSSPFYTAAGRWGNANIRYFDGRIDDLKFHSTAFYPSNFSPNCPNQPSHLADKGNWNFNSPSANIAIDSNSTNYHGNIIGAVKQVEEICKSGNSISLDGVNDFIDLGSLAGNNIRTIELWYKPQTEINTTLNRFKTLVARNTGLLGAQDDFEFGITFTHLSPNQGKLRFIMTDDLGSIYNVYSDSNKWVTNKWYHIAAVVHPVRGMKLFINGIQQNDSNAYSHHTDTSSFYTTLGRWGNFSGNRYIDGNIDDLKFHTTAIYSSNFIPDCPDQPSTIADHGSWNFNGSDPIIVIDSNFTNYNGTIHGANRAIDTICPLQIAVGSSKQTLSNQNVNIYPNPTKGIVQFTIDDISNTRLKVDIIDINGRTVLNTTVLQEFFSIDLSNFSNGIYFYRVYQESKIISTGKIIKH
ncbi:MAG: T9SS type A sorting domain-containing protein [Flavobacteriales bacterium]|nr:T9SS type A sorting domain-containing protein [Flavobacteriales bacterium]